MPPLKDFTGTLRARYTILSLTELKVEWIDQETNVVIWTETTKPREGWSAMSQIVCAGAFLTTNSYFIDEEGLRHFSMRCDPGQVGVLGQKLAVGGFKPN